VWKYHKTQVGAHAHTLTTIQGQIRQKIEGFADDEIFYGDTYAESVANISKQVSGDSKSAADLICYTHKRVADMRAHLLGVEVIHMGAFYEVKPVRVRLKKAILNQCTPFLEELDQNSVKLRFFFDDDCDVEIDKNMFSLAMYNFFSNAAKYTKLGSEIRLHYSDEKKSLDISMISLKMEKNEIKYLFQEGGRGRHAKDVAGKGIGLFVLQNALKIMGKSPMYIEVNHEKSFPEFGHIYNENHFVFSL
jgi:K+-sensing histidine kinase KdpD